MSLRLPGWIALVLVSSFPVRAFGQQEGEEPEGGGKKKKHAPLENLVELPADYVRYAHLPDGGTQPRLRRDEKGGLVLLFFRSSGAGGDLFLTRSGDDAATFAPAVRVNAREGTVAAAEGQHQATLGVGPDGRAHVAWVSTDSPPALCYAAEKDGAFGAELVLGSPPGLGSGAAVTVDKEGRIYVFYAATDENALPEATARNRIWMQRSLDGTTFSVPVGVDKEKHGVSELSAIAAHADAEQDSLFVLYRVGFDTPNPDDKMKSRDVRLLSSEDHGESFKSVFVDNWRLTRDPRTVCDLVQDATTTLATWEARGHVYWSAIKRQTNKAGLPYEPRDDEHAFHRERPSVSANERGEVLLAWLERPEKEPATAPRLKWQIWQKSTRGPVGRGSAPESEGSSAPSVLTRADGGFVILY